MHPQLMSVWSWQQRLPLRRLGRLAALVILAGCCVPGQVYAQALRPLPAEFIGALGDTEASLVQVAIVLKRIRNENISFSAPAPSQIQEFIGRMEKGLEQAQGQSGELRRRESLLVLLALNRTLGGVQHDVQAFSSMLQGARVRSPGALDALNASLAELEKGTARLNAALSRLDAGSQNLLERLDRVPAPVLKP